MKLKGHTGEIATSNGMRFSSDGNRLITCSRDGTIRIWDTQTGKELHCLGGLETLVTSIDISSDDQQLISSSTDSKVRLWNISEMTLDEPREVILNSWSISATFSPDNSLFAVSETESGSKTIQLWDVKTLECQRRLGKNLYAMIGSICFSPNGRWLATGDAESTTCLWDLQTGEEIFRYKHPHWIQSICFTRDSRYLASTGGKFIKIWDTELCEEEASWKAHSRIVQSCHFSPESKFMLSGGEDGKVILWDVINEEILKIYQHAIGKIGTVAFSPDGKKCAAAGETEIILWDFES